MKKTSLSSIVVLIIVVLMLSMMVGCANKETTTDTNKDTKEKPIVAVSIVPQKTFVEAVCGDMAEVIVMVPQEIAQQIMNRLLKRWSSSARQNCILQ